MWKLTVRLMRNNADMGDLIRYYEFKEWPNVDRFVQAKQAVYSGQSLDGTTLEVTVPLGAGVIVEIQEVPEKKQRGVDKPSTMGHTPR